jgi:hypothetical protein
MTDLEKLTERLQTLPPQLAAQYIAHFLKTIDDQQPSGDGAGKAKHTSFELEPFPVKKRVAGLGKGSFNLSEDFDAPLPDSFWLGEE